MSSSHQLGVLGPGGARAPVSEVARRIHTLAGLAGRTLALAAVLALWCIPASAEAAYKDISSDGPLEHIYIADDLGCQVKHALDEDLSFYHPSSIPGSCGTFLATGETVFSPSCCIDGVVFTPVSQSEVTGSGTPGDPYRVVTVVDAGTTGLRVTQTDSYVVGSESYRTDVEVSTMSGEIASGPTPVVLYHAADCFLQSSDEGFGFFDSLTGGIYCALSPNNSPPARVEGFAPITPGSHYMEAFYSTVWNSINGADFPDTVEPDVFQDNGAGLSWSALVPEGGAITRSLQTGFSPTGVVIAPQCSDGTDNDGDGKTDHPADSGCASPTDNDEVDLETSPQCSDGSDNDGDGKVDHPADPGCDSPADNEESDPRTDLEPALGKRAVAKPLGGQVNLLVPGASGCIRLEGADEIPMRSIIDVSSGEIRVITEEAEDESKRTADFSEGVFKLRQRKKNGFLTDAKLLEKSPCGSAGSKAKVATKKKGSRLFSSGKSGHRTTGAGGSATVRGTKWLTEELPEGRTRFTCIKGRLRIRDYILHKTVFILEGESYTTGQSP